MDMPIPPHPAPDDDGGGGDFHVGDTVRNRHTLARLTVQREGTWLARSYELVSCPHAHTAGMKPDEVLSRAIGLIRGSAANATAGLWTAYLTSVNTYPQGGRDHWYAGDVGPHVITGSEWPVCEIGNARWIALMSPDLLAPALEAWLRHALETWQATMRDHTHPTSDSDHAALEYARQLLHHAAHTATTPADTTPADTPDASSTPED